MTIQLAEPRWDTTYPTWQYHFSKRTALQKGKKSIYQNASLVVTEYFISLRTRFVAPPPWTLSAFTTETEHNTALASSKSLGAAVFYLGETDMHGSYT